MMVTFKLHGQLSQFVSEHTLDVANVREGFHALTVMYPSLYAFLMKDQTAYKICFDDPLTDEVGVRRDIDLLRPLTTVKTVHVVPVLAGSKSKILMVVIGVVIAIVGFYLLPVLGGLTPAMSASGMVGAGATVTTSASMFAAIGWMGVSLAISGIFAMLSPTPKLNTSNAEDRPGSSMYNGPTNAIKQTTPIALIYGGPVIVGSLQLSASVVNSVVNDAKSQDIDVASYSGFDYASSGVSLPALAFSFSDPRMTVGYDYKNKNILEVWPPSWNDTNAFGPNIKSITHFYDPWDKSQASWMIATDSLFKEAIPIVRCYNPLGGDAAKLYEQTRMVSFPYRMSVNLPLKDYTTQTLQWNIYTQIHLYGANVFPDGFIGSSSANSYFGGQNEIVMRMTTYPYYYTTRWLNNNPATRMDYYAGMTYHCLINPRSVNTQWVLFNDNALSGNLWMLDGRQSNIVRDDPTKNGGANLVSPGAKTTSRLSPQTKNVGQSAPYSGIVLHSSQLFGPKVWLTANGALVFIVCVRNKADTNLVNEYGQINSVNSYEGWLYATPNGVVTFNTWNEIYVVASWPTIYFFVNGAMVHSVTDNLLSDKQILHKGITLSVGRCLDGDIADVAVWEKPLTLREMEAFSKIYY